MRTPLALLLLLAAAWPVEAGSRVCRQVGQAIQCSDGSAAHQGSNGTWYQAVPPKAGAPRPQSGVEYYPDGKSCNVTGTTRTCR